MWLCYLVGTVLMVTGAYLWGYSRARQHCLKVAQLASERKDPEVWNLPYHPSQDPKIYPPGPSDIW